MPPFGLKPILHFTSVRAWFNHWLSMHPDAEDPARATWVARELGVGERHLARLIDEVKPFQPEHVNALARLTGLSAEEREYLGRLIQLQNADDHEKAAAKRSVWEMHAGQTGVPTAHLGGLLRARVPDPRVVLPALPVLALLPGDQLSPAALMASLRVPPDPAGLPALLAAWRAGQGFGEPRGPRLVELPGPGPSRHLGAAVWSALLDLGREGLVAMRAEERDLQVIYWAVDALAMDLADRSVDLLGRELRALSRRGLDQPVRRLHLILHQGQRLSAVLATGPREYRPAPGSEPEPVPPALTPPSQSAKVQEQGAAAADGAEEQPCLYHFLDLGLFARTWRDARLARGRAYSATWLHRRQERLEEAQRLSRTTLHGLVAGTVRLRAEHIPAVRQVFGLDPSMDPYLEGMARLAWACNDAERARARALLRAYAAAQGQRTLAGEDERFLSHWAPNVIYELATTDAYHHHPGWLMNALQGRLDWAAARDWMAVLETVGLLDADGRPLPLDALLARKGEDAWLAEHAQHASVLEQLQAELSLPCPDRRWGGFVLALPDALLPAARAALAAHRARLRQIGQDATARGATDRVALFATQLLPLTHELRRP